MQEREPQYGNAILCFDRIANIATQILNTEITPYDVAMIHVATKLARMVESRDKDDSYIDAINYLAFAAQFAPPASCSSHIQRSWTVPTSAFTATEVNVHVNDEDEKTKAA